MTRRVLLTTSEKTQETKIEGEDEKRKRKKNRRKSFLNGKE